MPRKKVAKNNKSKNSYEDATKTWCELKKRYEFYS